MDLTQTFPRSVHERLAGIVQLGRTLDKARAFNSGTLGQYHYNCGMDQALFEFLGSNKDDFAARARLSDAEFERWIRDAYLSKKSADDIDRWNREWIQHAPESGSQSEAYFLELRNQLAPDRTDIIAWADLLDLDEGRKVPGRHKIAA